jgi:amino-acid N-acetyltransferase
MIKIMKLNRTEIPYATELLKDNELPYSDINTESVQLFSIEQDKQTIGIIGFEQYGKHGLLRSFVIEKQYRSKGLGARILSDFEKMASEQGITEFFILTTTADKFFARNGFEVFDRNAVPQLIANTTEFDSICPASAVCMRKIL